MKKAIIILTTAFLLVGCGSRDEIVRGVAPDTNTETGTDPIIGDIGACAPAATPVTSIQYLGSDLVLNGSFEEGHNLGNNQWNVFAEVGAWKADQTYSDAGIEIQNGQTIGGLAPSDGDSKLEFDAHEKNGFTASDVALYQEIDTDSGDDYILTFDYSPRVQGNQTTNAAEVFFDGDLIATLNAEVKGWQKYTLIVKGAGTASKLNFKGYIDGNTVGGYLDNVKLKKMLPDSTGAAESVTLTTCFFN